MRPETRGARPGGRAAAPHGRRRRGHSGGGGGGGGLEGRWGAESEDRAEAPHGGTPRAPGAGQDGGNPPPPWGEAKIGARGFPRAVGSPDPAHRRGRGAGGAAGRWCGNAGPTGTATMVFRGVRRSLWGTKDAEPVRRCPPLPSDAPRLPTLRPSAGFRSGHLSLTPVPVTLAPALPLKALESRPPPPLGPPAPCPSSGAEGSVAYRCGIGGGGTWGGEGPRGRDHGRRTSEEGERRGRLRGKGEGAAEQQRKTPTNTNRYRNRESSEDKNREAGT